MNFQEIIKSVKQIDKKVITIVKNGLKGSFIFCLIASLILVEYTTIGDINAFYIGMALLKSSLYYIVGFIAFGFYFNKIK